MHLRHSLIHPFLLLVLFGGSKASLSKTRELTTAPMATGLKPTPATDLILLLVLFSLHPHQRHGAGRHRTDLQMLCCASLGFCELLTFLALLLGTALAPNKEEGLLCPAATLGRVSDAGAPSRAG